MTFDRFKNILRHSGAADPVPAGDGDAKLDVLLDLWRVPDCGELAARIYAAVTADERLRRQVFVFWRYSAVFFGRVHDRRILFRTVQFAFGSPEHPKLFRHDF